MGIIIWLIVGGLVGWLAACSKHQAGAQDRKGVMAHERSLRGVRNCTH